MLGFQTLTCLHDIPVVRSSTNKLQDVYTKAKDTSVFIRVPCNLAETVADKSLKVALTVVNPFVKPLSGPVRVIDDYAAEKIRQIETKYPVINTPTEDVIHTFAEKTEPVRNVMNSVKDTTTSTIQHGKETVSNVASATVNKASCVADSIYSFCGSHVPTIQRRKSGKSVGLIGYIGSLFNHTFEKFQTSLLWFRMLSVFFLLKIKQINDVILTKTQQIPILPNISQRLLILSGSLLEYVVQHIQPDDRTLAELKKAKQQSKYNQPTPFFINRSTVKSNPTSSIRQNVSNTITTRTDDLTQSTFDFENDLYTTEPVHINQNSDIQQLHERIRPTDIEVLYSRVPADVLPNVDNQEPSNSDDEEDDDDDQE